MKRLLAVLLLLLFCTPITATAFPLYYDGKTVDYSGPTITLLVNDQEVLFDMPPIIIQDRTLVPLRGVFEELGASVFWEGQEKRAGILLEETEIWFNLEQGEVTVNQTPYPIDVPAKIINDRTMIPVRFIAEALGFLVGWDPLSYTVSVSQPPSLSVEKITYQKDALHVQIQGEEELNYNAFLLGKRLVVDIENATLRYKGDFLHPSTEGVLEIRWSQYKKYPPVVRLVIDQETVIPYAISKIKNGLSIQLTPAEPPAEQLPEVSDEVLSEKAKDLLVMIDPGHGGTDVGSLGKEDGKVVLQEKEVNLDISLRLRNLLQQAGASVKMTRSKDEAVDLFERPEIANEAGADLFLSVHANSFTSPEANGTTVLYHPDGDDSYGITSKQFATLVQKELVDALGTTNRPLLNGEQMVVIRKTEMPAIIAEIAFLSSPHDLKLLLDDTFRQKAAEALCRATVRALNRMALQ